jgi:hypothetical protein
MHQTSGWLGNVCTSHTKHKTRMRLEVRDRTWQTISKSCSSDVFSDFAAVPFPRAPTWFWKTVTRKPFVVAGALPFHVQFSLLWRICELKSREGLIQGIRFISRNVCMTTDLRMDVRLTSLDAIAVRPHTKESMKRAPAREDAFG